MARLYTVVPLWEAERLWRRRRLGLDAGGLVVEEKLDGVLAVGYGGAVYTGSGRRAPGWLLHALEEAGADLAAASRGGRLVYAEVYGRCVPGETGVHRREERCYRAAFLDAGVAPAHAAGVGEAAALARMVQHPERLEVAEAYGLEQPRRAILGAWAAPREPRGLVDLLALYPGREGVVVKLYQSMGHRLPPDHGARLRGLLAVKLRWEWFARRWR
jgi:hypothetical protein